MDTLQQWAKRDKLNSVICLLSKTEAAWHSIYRHTVM